MEIGHTLFGAQELHPKERELAHAQVTRRFTLIIDGAAFDGDSRNHIEFTTHVNGSKSVFNINRLYTGLAIPTLLHGRYDYGNAADGDFWYVTMPRTTDIELLRHWSHLYSRPFDLNKPDCGMEELGEALDKLLRWRDAIAAANRLE